MYAKSTIYKHLMQETVEQTLPPQQAWKQARRWRRIVNKHPRSDLLRSKARKSTTSIEQWNAVCASFPCNDIKHAEATAIVRAGLDRHYRAFNNPTIHVIAGGYSHRTWHLNHEHDHEEPDRTSPIVLFTAWRETGHRGWGASEYMYGLAGRDENTQPWAIRISPRAWSEYRHIGDAWERATDKLASALRWIRPPDWKRYDILIRQGDTWAMGKWSLASSSGSSHVIELTHPEHATILLPPGYVWTLGRTRRYNGRRGTSMAMD